jgi:hypothetical protein
MATKEFLQVQKTTSNVITNLTHPYEEVSIVPLSVLKNHNKTFFLWFSLLCLIKASFV